MKEILVVDDDPGFRIPLVDILRLEFPKERFRGVADFDCAGALLDEQMAKVMLLDICLQGSGGAHHGHALLAMARDYQVPVIVISGSEAELQTARETHEAIAHVLKDATPQSFTRIVAALKLILVAINGHE